MARLAWIERTVLPEMRSGRHRSPADASLGRLSARREDGSVSFGYLQIEDSAPSSGPWLLGYELDEDELIGALLPRILAGVDLGEDIRVAILDEGGRVRFPRTTSVPSALLAAGHFAEILPAWQVGVFHPDGRSINELAWREKATSPSSCGVNSQGSPVRSSAESRRREGRSRSLGWRPSSWIG